MRRTVTEKSHLPKEPDRSADQIARIVRAVTLDNDLRENIATFIELKEADTWLCEAVEDVLMCVATHGAVSASSLPEYILTLFSSPMVDFYQFLEKARTMNRLYPNLVKNTAKETPRPQMEESHA
jgi:hypothetical protein